MSSKIFLLLSFYFVLPSCLQTAAELRSNPNRQQSTSAAAPVSAPTPPPIVTKQQKEAAEVLRTDDINRDFRELNGRVEVIENQMNELKDSEKVRLLEGKVTQLEAKLNLLETTVSELHAKSKKEVTWAGDNKEAAKVEVNPLHEANKLYEKQKWDEAAAAFEDYRKNSPKGAGYPEATLKIGLCFQNMGMKDDAKAFFKEVVDKFPKSKEAGLAKTKLKKL